jgi:hypothetical protein
MTDAELAQWTRYALLALGTIFLVANLRATVDLLSWLQRRRSALVAWFGPKPPYYGLMLGIGFVLGLLVLLKAYMEFRTDAPVIDELRGFAERAFGELMMFLYYGYALPLSTRIRRGLYSDGVWTDTGFMRYDEIGALRWKDDATLVFASRAKAFARSLHVPGGHISEVRRLLRDKIQSHAIATDAGPGLHLGARDARDSV